MTLEETGAIMSLLNVAFPKFYYNQNETQKGQALKLWASLFSDDDFNLVTAAVKSLIVANKFPPTISEVKDKMAFLLNPDEVTEMEAWNMVKKAVINLDRFNPGKEFDRLPAIVQRLLGSSNTLVEYSMQDDETFSVTASNFMRSYKARRRSEREYEALPDDVKALASRLKSLPEGEKSISEAQWNRNRNENIAMLEEYGRR